MTVAESVAAIRERLTDPVISINVYPDFCAVTAYPLPDGYPPCTVGRYQDTEVIDVVADLDGRIHLSVSRYGDVDIDSAAASVVRALDTMRVPS